MPAYHDDVVFDCAFLLAAATVGFRLGDIPALARHFPEASSINFRRSLTYGVSSPCLSPPAAR